MAEIPAEAAHATDDPWDLLEMLKDVRIRFWACLNPDHKAVTWTEDVARCDTCGLTSEMTSARYAKVREAERARIVADLHAEGERERERLREFKGLGPDVDPCHVSGELNSWITAWGAAAKFVQGEQAKPKLIIRNHPREAFPKETP